METFYTTVREKWREWLLANSETKDEIWFVFPMKASGEKSLSYNDAVEEALCFGWIDSTIKHIDAVRRAQRFTPRKEESTYSRANIERLIYLERQGLLHPAVRAAVLPIISAPYDFPEDIIAAIRQNDVAWRCFQTFPEGYKRIRIAYIDAARNRPLEFARRLDSFIRKTEKNKMIAGFGGIDKYYNL